MKHKKTVISKLTTPFQSKMDKKCPWVNYPRPQLVRDSYLCLNGEWLLECKNKGVINNLGKILVPFSPESQLSGINMTISSNSTLIYSRTFEIDSDFNKGVILLHFGAVDQIAKVFINDNYVGEHHGGYLPFKFEVTSFVKVGSNTIKVEVVDNLDINYPYGKQRKKRGGMWYTPISGIWQTVWMESVPKKYIERIKITPTLDSVNIRVFGGENKKRITFFNGEIQQVIEFEGQSVDFEIDNPVLWSPENPHLYQFTLCSGEDTVQSYFALRKIDIKEINGNSVICLNDKPYYFHGLLDQGYYSDGIYLPATPEGFEFDILEMKKLGFNMLRKHIKIEPEIFYYLCDLHGMVVFQDFVNSGKYNFVVDTALPTAFLRWGVTHFASKKRRDLFESANIETVERLYNHPCICYYTIFNEGWGQYNPSKHYYFMKKLDGSRVWDTTSGWFKTRHSDVSSEHIYFKPVRLKAKNKPLVLSEFGGYSLKIISNSYNQTDNYGYRSYTDKNEFQKGIEQLYLNEIVPCIKNGLCASVLTQVSDVEDETNGLVTYDRQIVKVEEQSMKNIAKILFDEFNNKNQLDT